MRGRGRARGREDRTAAFLSLAPVVVLVLGALTTLVLPGTQEDPPIRTALLVTLSLFFPLLVARLVHTARRTPARRTPLYVLAGAVALWAAGSASVSAEQTMTVVTFPAPGEVLCLLSYLGMAAFVILDARYRRVPGAAVWLEAAIVCGAAVCLASAVVLAPLSSTFEAAGSLPLLLAVLYPLINLVLAGIVLGQIMLRQRARSVRSMALLVGFVGLAVADSSFLAGLSTETYSVSLVVDAIWGGSFAAITAAATARPTMTATVPLRPRAGVLAVGAGLAVALLVLDPEGMVGWVVKSFALVTLLCTGARMMLALREARGAAEALRLSLTDELTGLPNRRSLLAVADRALQQGRPTGIMLLDLDGFKDINDSLGHAMGDEVLVALSARLRATLGQRIVVARLGGDEFALLTPTDDELRLFEIAHEVRAVLREPLRVDSIDVSIDASIGITVRHATDTSATELLRRADIAMYQAKEARTGAMLYDDSLDGFSRERLGRVDALRQGIAEGQLEVWYQPQVDARTRRVVAVEALVRWQHPTDGLLPPITFLPDARRAGLMPALTEAVLCMVVADARRWIDEGSTFRVAMNWAPPELVGGPLLKRLFAELAAADLPPGSLIVEVTEDSFLADPERARAALLELRAHDVQVAIDDYGTGFSSLAYLRDLPVQELKMDRSFVSPVADDERSRMIVQTTSQMARALGMRFVAEGVEDADAAAELLPLGVDVFQGYHIARPMPADAVGPWVHRWHQENAIELPTPRGAGPAGSGPADARPWSTGSRRDRIPNARRGPQP